MLDFLIIGKNGQLATEFSKILGNENASYISFSRKELDISDSKSFLKIKKLKPKKIINTSSFHVLAECEKYPLKAFEINSVAVGNLARISKEIGAKFVTISTNYVFDGENKDPYLENDRVNPLQMYGISKLAGEFDAINNYSEGSYIIRTCGLYGNGKKGSKDKKGNFILKVLSEAKNSGVVKASSLEIVNPTYAKDLSNGIIKLLSLNTKPGIYNLVNEGAINWYDFAKLIIKYKKLDAKVVKQNDNFSLYKRPLNSSLSNSKARKNSIFMPTVVDGLTSYIEEI